ncbi:MAG TPA: hypothetical protein VK070_10615 [Acidimicrobiia bacterium]|jgi:nucleoid-associated protein YgaU|nr:hypothetical protein [Acidimicrobiia bacterium]
MRRVWTVAVWLAGYSAALYLLHALSQLPWLRVEWSDPVGWLAETETEVVIAAAAWLAAAVLLGWVSLSTVAYSLARLAGFAPNSVDWLSIGPLRKAVDALLAGSMFLGTISPAAAAVDSTPTGSAVAVDPRYIPVPAGSNEAVRPDPVPHAPAVIDRVVAPGEHLWGLAEETLEAHLGRPPTEAEIVPYWRKVVASNRDRIRSGDPDLIFPGEVIVLPPLEISSES